MLSLQPWFWLCRTAVAQRLRLWLCGSARRRLAVLALSGGRLRQSCAGLRDPAGGSAPACSACSAYSARSACSVHVSRSAALGAELPLPRGGGGQGPGQGEARLNKPPPPSRKSQSDSACSNTGSARMETRSRPTKRRRRRGDQNWASYRIGGKRLAWTGVPSFHRQIGGRLLRGSWQYHKTQGDVQLRSGGAVRCSKPPAGSDAFGTAHRAHSSMVGEASVPRFQEWSAC